MQELEHDRVLLPLHASEEFQEIHLSCVNATCVNAQVPVTGCSQQTLSYAFRVGKPTDYFYFCLRVHFTGLFHNEHEEKERYFSVYVL